MANRATDWLRQADADLRHAGNARETGGYEWACFAAHQAAEKAVKAVFLARAMEAWGHTVTTLLTTLGESSRVPTHLIESAKSLDKHYIPTRYPNGFEQGAPTDFYTDAEAANAIERAAEIIEFCRSQMD
jgi:HEPN domain-containing protein